MEKELFAKAIAQLRKDTVSRKFSQSFDIIVTFKDLDIKKPDQQVDFYFNLPKGVGANQKICGLVGPELIEEAKREFDTALVQAQFEQMTKKDVKKLADEYDYFVAQANIMPKIAAVFGRVFGPRGKMPNPKAGCVVPPKANLKAVYEKLVTMVRLRVRTAPVIQAKIGTDKMSDADLIENAYAVYDQVIHHLPKEKNNLRAVYVKFSMSKVIKVL